MEEIEILKGILNSYPYFIVVFRRHKFLDIIILYLCIHVDNTYFSCFNKITIF